MNILLTTTPQSSSFFGTAYQILVAVLVFGFLIFIHELGHFVTAKKSGVRVHEFAIGMGPTLVSKTIGDTKYALRLLPIGGFVAMEGEDEHSEASDSFRKASVLKRTIILLAGATMNIIFGFLLVTLLTYYQAGQPGAMFASTTIGGFADDAKSSEYLEVGDNILKVDGRKINNYSDLSFYISQDKDGIVDILVDRSDEKVLLEGVKFNQEEVAEGIFYGMIDFKVKGVEPTFFSTLQMSFVRTGDVARQVWKSLADLVTGSIGIKHMSGPIGITEQIGSVANRQNWTTFVAFVAMISINLGIVNLLPFPALDGGKIFLIIIEAIRRKPLKENFEIYVNLVGIVALFMLMIVVSFNDILKLIKG